MPDIARSAEFSADQLYRYRLSRVWADGPRATFVMVNPSTADAASDDPTIRRCIGFARAWGLSGVNVVNLYAFRATKPRDLWSATDPVGPDNDRYLLEAAANDDMLVAAWGAHAKPARVREVLALGGFQSLSYLQLTARGVPRHPLYLPRGLVPRPWAKPSAVGAGG